MKKSSSPRYSGKVGISCIKDRLRLSLPRRLYDGQQRYHSLKLTNTPENWKIAEAIAATIELDIALGCFDYTLEKYKPNQKAPPKQPKRLTLVLLYDEYIQTLIPTARPGTINNGYLVTLRRIKRSPFCDVDASTIVGQDVYDWAIQTYNPDTTARLVTQLNASYVWGIDKRLLKGPSPFAGLSAKAKKRNKSKASHTIETFGVEEPDKIIQLCKTHPRHKHYWLYIAFCFLTGCRPSEAIALRWSDVAPDLSELTFNSAILAGKGGRQRYQGLKTQPSRTFPCSDNLRAILTEARSRGDSELVFPTVTGKPINPGDFIRKHWRPLLKDAGVKYRSPYKMRHTFITRCLEAGIDAKDVAAWVGNSPETIYRRYAGVNKKLSVPNFLGGLTII